MLPAILLIALTALTSAHHNMEGGDMHNRFRHLHQTLRERLGIPPAEDGEGSVIPPDFHKFLASFREEVRNIRRRLMLYGIEPLLARGDALLTGEPATTTTTARPTSLHSQIMNLAMERVLHSMMSGVAGEEKAGGAVSATTRGKGTSSSLAAAKPTESENQDDSLIITLSPRNVTRSESSNEVWTAP